MVNKKLAHRTLCAKKSSLFYSNNEEATKGVETYFLYLGWGFKPMFLFFTYLRHCLCKGLHELVPVTYLAIPR